MGQVKSHSLLLAPELFNVSSFRVAQAYLLVNDKLCQRIRLSRRPASI
jgi:hypothetical protein